jgi:[ribosomal protein S5]-alanine N-acetyltransferase
MIEIVTDRLIIRNFDDTDFDDLCELISDYSKSIYARYDQKWPKTKDELHKVLEWFSNNDVYLAVVLKSENAFIGFINLVKENIENPITYNLGYVLHSNYHNNGYAYEACTAYIAYAKSKYGVQEIVTGTAKDNNRSCRLLEKLGFIKIKEEEVNLQTDEYGNPINFIGCMYKVVL